MKMRLKVLVPLGLLLLAATWLFWPRGGDAPSPAQSPVAPVAVVASVAPVAGTNAAPVTNIVAVTRSVASTNRVAFRLTNTSRTLDEMTASPRAILLENALVDTAEKLELNIPKHLRAAAEPGAFIVQAQGPVTAAFRAALKGAGAEIVSYIPNNAYLVQLSGAGAGALAGNPQVRAVLPYEPYFKVQASLLGRAVDQKPLSEGQVLTLGLFANGAQATMAQIENLGGRILVVDRSPFGPVVRVRPATDWLALAQLPGVQRVEPATRRQIANDLTRVTMNLATDYYVTNFNWMGLSGSNVLVVVNDTGIDPNHPDFATSRVTGYDTNSLQDIDGHGTHVAGIIAGNGSQSFSPVNVGSVASGSVTNADFRGKAPLAKLFAVGFLGANDTNIVFTDAMLQEIPALTNALICNNSWVNSGAFEYDLSASSFDAAVRDALPGTTGPQPVLYVFGAGNAGRSEDPDGIGGVADSILSPATAKNVITVGALEQFRNITNEVVALDGTTNQPWLLHTDSSTQVADYSSRGNVGIYTEGTYGRFKPDLVAPGTFVVSTRPGMWDKAAYYNPTNYHDQYSQFGLTVTSNQLAYGGGDVPINGVGLTITVQPNRLSPDPFPANFPIYLSLTGLAGPTNFAVATSNNVLAIPPGGGSLTDIGPLLNNSFSCAVGSPTNIAINFDLIIQIATTNDDGNRLIVLSNLNETLGSSYYYESGTSMAAPAVSGALALLQDFFVNQRNPAYATNPSPALLKAMLINGARLTPGYNEFALTNTMNYEGWGLLNVPNTLPASLTNTTPGAISPIYLLDQSPTNALATGDSRTFNVNIPTALALAQGLRFTLVWTDPPGNPSAGLKLVNNLDLVVTNLDNPTNPIVYYGNVFGSGKYSAVVDSNTPPDAVNNVENIWLNGPLGTNYAVTVLGRNVAVNAVTAEQTNVVQDFALVITGGNSVSTNGFTVTPVAPTPTTAVMPQVTYIDSYTNGIYFNQLAGANAPWLSTNAIAMDPANLLGTNASLFVGQTNQWHFYVVTNTTTFSNAAFIIFLPQTQSTPRMGVFTYSRENATREEADLNLFVASVPDPNAGTLTNLNLTVISNCVYNVNGDQASLSRGGTKFIAYSNAAPQQVYYIGVQCQDQLGAEYGFLAVFSEQPFSTLNPDGSQTVNGLLLPAPIPDGTPELGGVAYVFGLALYPMEMDGVTVTNTITHQNYGDLIGILNHNNTAVVLNNHDALHSVVNLTRVYNDDGLAGTEAADGPGTLRSFKGKEAVGPWFLTQVDDSLNQTGSITGFTLNIQPHKDLEKQPFTTVSVPPGGWWFGYVDADVGYTNLLVVATNLPPTSTPPIQLYLNYGSEPDFVNYLVRADLTNGTPPGNSISYGPPLQPGRYFVGLYNPDTVSHDVLIGVILSFNASAITEVNWDSSGPLPLLDDVVNYSSIIVTNNDLIQSISVGLRVDHPRISDLVFHLISPDGGRYLLMENRGGQSTNGCGATLVTTNEVNVSDNGTSLPQTNSINVGLLSGTFPITYNFYTAPDRMTVYYGTNVAPANLILDTGLTNNPPVGAGAQDTQPRTVFVSFPPIGLPADSTYLTIVINEGIDTNRATLWTYTAGGLITNNYYLTFTEDTNLTTTPIKYAVPPLVPGVSVSQSAGTAITTAWEGSFEGTGSDALVSAVTNFAEGWQVNAGSIKWLVNGSQGSSAYQGTNYIDLNGTNAGAISISVPKVPGSNYVLSFAYARNPDSIAAGTVPQATLDVGGTLTNLTVAPAVTNDWTNLLWSVTNVAFAAGASNTLIAFTSPAGGTNGVLLDAVVLKTVGSVTNTFINASDLYYLPEESLEALIRTRAAGEWQLEILDNRAGATNNANLVSWRLNFTYANTNLPPTPPVITAPATGISATGATLNALVYVPGAADTILFFEYGTSTNYELGFTTALLVTNNLNIQQALGIAVTNLPTPDIAYHFQAVISNSTGIYRGGDLTFFAHAGPPPYAATLPATLVTGPGAQLNGFATPNVLPSTAWFEWGTNVLYGNRTAPVSVGAGYNVVYTTAQLTGLTPNHPYHYRLVVSNAFTTTVGFDQVLDQAYVVAWGAGYAGQISVPLGLSNVVAVSAGYDHSLALKNNGQAVAWGDNNFGQATVPSGLNNLVAVAGGDAFSLALQAAGTVAAWGNNNLGQTNVPGSLSNVVSIAAGAFSSLALQADGQVTTWGFGFLNAPAGLSNVVSVAGGKFHSLALKADGTVTAWGDNGSGQLNVPPGLSNVVAIAAGNFHNLALKYDGTVVAWGGNSSGQTNVPAGLSGVAAIAAGGFHSLALRAGDGIVAWGDPSAGQISVPSGLTNVVAISAGYLHNLALTSTMPNSTNPPVFDLLAGAAITNSILGNSLTYYRVDVPANADLATNALLFAQNGLLNLWFSTNTPARIGATNATLLLGGVTNGVSIFSVSSNGLPPLVPGATYYLGVQNTNASSVFYAVSVNFHLLNTNPPPALTNLTIASIVYTNIASSNGFLLTWFAPSNYLFQVQWVDSLASTNWQTFTNPLPVTYNTNIAPVNPTNAQFNFFDNGSQAPFTGMRFYRLLVVTNASNVAPVFSLGAAATRYVTPTTPLTVTNNATDANAGQTLTYALLSPPGGVTMTNGVIYWTPSSALAGTTNTITTVVTDNGSPALSTTNVITVLVNPLASISSVTYGTNGTTLQWTAWTNEQFQVRWATNLVAPITWTPFPETITSTNGAFVFVDTNAPLWMKFYQLVLLP